MPSLLEVQHEADVKAIICFHVQHMAWAGMLGVPLAGGVQGTWCEREMLLSSSVQTVTAA